MAHGASPGGADILPALILYADRRDRALAPGRSGRKTSSLLAYYRKRNRLAVDRLARAAFLRGIVQECRGEIERSIESGDDTPEIRRKVENLMALTARAVDEMERLTRV